MRLGENIGLLEKLKRKGLQCQNRAMLGDRTERREGEIPPQLILGRAIGTGP